MKNPWMKFYPSDWRADPALRSCSISARGLWIEMLAIMHDAEPYGSLLVNGQRIDKKRLSALAGVPERDCSVLLLELEGVGVFSRDEDGTIYSRRMRRDAAKAEGGRNSVARKWGALKTNDQTRSQRLSESRSKGRHTSEEWDGMLDICDHKCVRCGAENVPMVKDHIIPIYQGGSDSIENLQPLCTKCNSSKGPETKDCRHFGWKKRLGEWLGEDEENASERSTQKPEARSQKETRASALSSDWPSDYREQFWTVFPNKVGKPMALKKLDGIARGATRWDDLMAGLDRYIRTKPSDRAWLNPGTFLNQERWADQPASIVQLRRVPDV